MIKRYMPRNRILNLTLVFLIVLVSVIYSSGKGLNFINVFLNTEREVPIYSVETKERKIALTFDVAIGNEYIEDILKILDKNGVKATFFVIGNWVNRYEDVLKRMDNEGHEIGNHSTTHPHFTQLSPQKMKEEIYNTSSRIKSITGKDIVIFRPPFGDYNSDVVKTVRESGYYCIQWDVDSLDWTNPGKEAIYERVMKKTSDGSILLFHNNASQTPEILDRIIKDLKVKGYEFVKVTDLIYKDNYYVDHTGRQKLIR